MFDFEDSDYEALSGFGLLWRWTSPNHAEFPANILNGIRPIADSKAALINEYVVARADQHGRLELEFFTDVRRINAGRKAESAVRDWLTRLPVADDATVIVSWDARTAVTAPFRLVADCWSDFFYPASDDAAVIPLRGE